MENQMTFVFEDDFVLPSSTQKQPEEEDTKLEEEEIVPKDHQKPEDDNDNDDEDNVDENDDDDDDDDDGEEIDEETQEYIKNHFEFMKEKGYIHLPEDYEFDGDLYKVYQKDATLREQAVINEIVSSVNERTKPVLNYILNGGDDIEQITILARQEDIMSNINVDSEEDAEKYALYYLKNTKGLDEDVALSVVETMKDKGILEEKAKEYYEADFENIQKEKQSIIQNQEKARREQKEAQEQYLLNASKFIESKEWEASSKEMIKQEVFGNKTVSKLQHIITSDPVAFVELAKFLFKYSPEKGITELVDKKEKAKAAKNVKTGFFEKAASKRNHSSPSSRSRKNKNRFDLPGNYDITF